jgi:uncharacterized protein YciI
MQYFAVLQGPGPRWDPDKSRSEQAGWPAHAEFMNGLAESGFVVLGGPVDETHALLIIEAAGQNEIEQRFAADPWKETEVLSEIWIKPWEILLDRNAETQPS